MKRSEKVLLLITSSVLLSSCNRRHSESMGADWSSSDSPTSGQVEGGTQNGSGTQGTSSHHGSGVSVRPGFYGRSGGSSSSSHSGGESASSGSSRGGFGGHGGGGGE